LPVLPFGDKRPKIDSQAYISPQATVMGDVEISAGSSVWPGAVIRGDLASVRIGENSCIQDSVVIHAHNEENPAIIGNNVIISTATAIHGVYVGDNVFIQEGCVVFDGATLGEGVSLAPGSIVPPNIVIPPRTLNSGAPAAQIREVSREDIVKHTLRVETITQVFLKLKRWQPSA
jgi:carbonic anhydrase/acetyltransferase-like protein (isoleucine patch superfamily)